SGGPIFKIGEKSMYQSPPPGPEEGIVALFKTIAVKNPAQPDPQNRPILDDEEQLPLRSPGARNVSGFPARAFARWGLDPETGEQVKQSYAERFSHQYRQFKAHSVQTKSGTPLTVVPFLTEARRAELRALNIYTVEALAAVDGQELKNLGQNGRD